MAGQSVLLSTFKVTAAETQTVSYSISATANGIFLNSAGYSKRSCPVTTHSKDFLVEFDFGRIGRKSMLLNARRLVLQSDGSRWILLAIEGVTERTLRAGPAA